MFCVYRFFDENENIIYVGKTKNLKKRMTTQHFTIEGHLPKRCYDSVKRVEYTELPTRSDMDIIELYYINVYKPIYNKQSKQEELLDLKLEVNHVWHEYRIRKDNYIKDLEEKYINLKKKCKEYEEQLAVKRSSEKLEIRRIEKNTDAAMISDLKTRFLMALPLKDSEECQQKEHSNNMIRKKAERQTELRFSKR